MSSGCGVCVCDQEAVDQAFEQPSSVMALDGRNGDELVDHYCVGHLEELQAEALSNVSHHKAANFPKLSLGFHGAVIVAAGHFKAPASGAAICDPIQLP